MGIKISNLLFIAIVALLTIQGCRKKEVFITDTTAKLQFSSDTLYFDTVFTQIGSATRILKVINSHSQSIRISKIYVKSGSNRFRLNIDGVSGNSITNVEIAAHDSLYMFGEVTVDPDQPASVSPFVIDDAIVFETNGNTQEVALVAWGQNANYIPNRWSKGQITVLSCNLSDITWNDPKPYVIYGILVIDSCTLHLPPGARIHIHGGLATASDTSIYNDGIIFVLPDGKIKAEGTYDKPVTIQGDRLENDNDIDFSSEAGQWAGIRFASGSKGNNLTYTEIKNSIIGARVDSAAELSLSHCKIHNTTSAGLVGIHAKITGDNCLLYNNGGNALQVIYGGDYNFTYSTMVNYDGSNSALSLSNVLCLDELCNSFRGNALHVNFTNSIVYGGREDEIDLLDRYGGTQPDKFVYQFDHCLVRVKDILKTDAHPEFVQKCTNCIYGKTTDRVFKDSDNDNYHLDSLSVGIDLALPISGYPFDLDNIMRDLNKPDLGCFEFK